VLADYHKGFIYLSAGHRDGKLRLYGKTLFLDFICGYSNL